jgi:Sec-independent protein secretion pathway component TatC
MGLQLIDPSQVVQRFYDAFNIVPKFSNASVAIITKPTSMLMSLMAMIPMQLLFGVTAAFARCT